MLNSAADGYPGLRAWQAKRFDQPEEEPQRDGFYELIDRIRQQEWETRQMMYASMRRFYEVIGKQQEAPRP